MEKRPPLVPRRQHRRPLRTALIAAALAGLIGAAWYWSDHRAAPEATESDSPGKPRSDTVSAPSKQKTTGPEAGKKGNGKPQPVVAIPARTMNIRIWLNALGTVTPGNLANVRAKVDGTLLKVHFREGQLVRKGDLLAEIDPRPYQIELNQAQGQLKRDTALLDNARLDLKRYQDLLVRDAIARQQVETQEALVRQLQGTVEADQSQVDHARLQLQYARVTAPASGRIGLRQIDPGNQVRAADSAGLASIAQTQPIAVLFAIPEANLPAISRRLASRQPIAVEAWDREQKHPLGEGRVLTTDNQIDPATGTIKIKAEFANRDGALFPNQFVNVRLLLDTVQDAVAIPTAALQRGDKGNFVYRVEAGGQVSQVPVTPGAIDGDWQAVEGALKAGEKLVTDGTDKLRDGAKVELIDPNRKGKQSTKPNAKDSAKNVDRPAGKPADKSPARAE